MTFSTRITKYTKTDSSSPGWRSAAEFADVRDGVSTIAGVDQAVLTTYLNQWANLRINMQHSPALAVDLLTLDDGPHHLTVLAFNNETELQAMIDFLESSGQLADFEAARDALAANLNVSVSVHQPVTIASFASNNLPTAASLLPLLV